MSNRQGCLSFLFCCARKQERKRNAISVENNSRIKNISTQTQENPLRSSAPNSFFPSPHKPIIAVRDSNGFKIQSANKEKIVIRNNEDFSNQVVSVLNSNDIESINSDRNNEPIASSNTIQRLFSPDSQGSGSKVVPDLFLCSTTDSKPKLKPITPQQFLRRKLKPILRYPNSE